MATQELVSYQCDLDGEPIPDGQHVTIPLTARGLDRTLDLCAAHGAVVDAMLARARRPEQPRRSGADRERAAGIRAWALCNGIEVEARGRIPADVVARYEAAEG